jgi:hydroxymethylpyrimidine pyrophosphatase-like HAD family hydrolase
MSHDKGPFAGDIEQIVAAHRLGHRIFLNTGRALANIPPALRGAPWINGIACGGGGHVLIDGKTVYHKWASEEILCAAAAYYLANKKWIVFEGETGLYGVNQPDPALFAAPVLEIKNKDDFLHKYKNAVITKLTLNGKIADGDREVLGGFFQVNQFTEYFEGIIKGESKSKAMNIILETIGIAPKDSIAIGDGLNDIDAIRAAGLGIAMGNACDELKAAAGAITGDWAHEGVGKALQRFVLSC